MSVNYHPTAHAAYQSFTEAATPTNVYDGAIGDNTTKAVFDTSIGGTDKSEQVFTFPGLTGILALTASFVVDIPDTTAGDIATPAVEAGYSWDGTNWTLLQMWAGVAGQTGVTKTYSIAGFAGKNLNQLRLFMLAQAGSDTVAGRVNIIMNWYDGSVTATAAAERVTCSALFGF